MKDSKNVKAAGLAAVAVVLLATSCGGPSRDDVLGDLATSGIAPMYERLAHATDGLAAATVQLCDSPNTTSLGETRVALADARSAWSETEAAWIGPAMGRRSWAVIDWPIAPEEIEQLIDDETVTLDIERLGKGIGADQRGLGALEYILGPPQTDADLSERRCDYLQGVAEVIHEEATVLAADWTTSYEGVEPYVDQMRNEASASLDALISDALFLLEDIGDRELGTALGEMSREADLERIVEGDAGLATADIEGHLIGLRTVLIGNGETDGLAPLLGDDIVRRLEGQFDVAETAASSVGSPLRADIETNPAAARELREAVKAIQRTIGTEVVSRLGVTIGFSDADGDTGA